MEVLPKQALSLCYKGHLCHKINFIFSVAFIYFLCSGGALGMPGKWLYPELHPQPNYFYGF